MYLSSVMSSSVRECDSMCDEVMCGVCVRVLCV